jgi:hypothetical protein
MRYIRTKKACLARLDQLALRVGFFALGARDVEIVHAAPVLAPLCVLYSELERVRSAFLLMRRYSISHPAEENTEGVNFQETGPFSETMVASGKFFITVSHCELPRSSSFFSSF